MVPDTSSLRSYVPSSRPDKPILCLVCSDKSFGNNFGAITCESCKAFFRRTANERDKLACPFNDNCEITIATRKHCRKCRLEKCFAVGMIKEWIQSEEQLKIRRAILKERKLRRGGGSNGLSIKRPKLSGGGDSLSMTVANARGNANGNGDLERRVKGSRWEMMVEGQRSESGARLKHQWPQLSNSSTSSQSTNENDNFKPTGSRSVAQFFNKITDRNFFAHLVNSNAEALKETTSSPIQRSSVITFTGKSSASSSPSLSVDSSLDQVIQDRVLHSDNRVIYHEPLTNDSISCESDQNVIGKKQSIETDSHLTSSKTSSSSSTIATAIVSPSQSVQFKNSVRKTPEPSTCKQTELWINEEIDKDEDNVNRSNIDTSTTTSTSTYDSTKSVSLNVFHHIIDSYFTRINMRNERQMSSLALNSMEESRLIELTLAYGVFNEPLQCISEMTIDSLIVNCYNTGVCQLMNMTKRLTAYTELPIEDQLILLRGSFADILAMRGTFLFDLGTQAWPVKGTKMSVKLTSLMRYDQPFYLKYADYMTKMNPIWRNNIFINQLIVTIMLFNYNLPDLKNSEAIRLEYCAYIYLLQRYLAASRNFADQPKETLCQILSKIDQLRELNFNLVRLTRKKSKDDLLIGCLESIFMPD